MPSGYRIRLLHSDRQAVEFHCPGTSTITDAARQHGIRMAVACERGGCGACRSLVVSGTVAYLGQVSRTKTEDPQTGTARFLLPCRAIPRSDLILQPLHPWERFSTTPLSARLGGPG